MGLEHPMSHGKVVTSENDKTHRVQCSYLFAPPLEPWKSQSYIAVLGLAPRDQLRWGFLYYLERERAHPYRPFLPKSLVKIWPASTAISGANEMRSRNSV